MATMQKLFAKGISLLGSCALGNTWTFQVDNYFPSSKAYFLFNNTRHWVRMFHPTARCLPRSMFSISQILQFKLLPFMCWAQVGLCSGNKHHVGTALPRQGTNCTYLVSHRLPTLSARACMLSPKLVSATFQKVTIPQLQYLCLILAAFKVYW